LKTTKQSIKLTRPQSSVFVAQDRFRVLVCGRRFGKTFLAMTWLIHNALKFGGVHWYVAPSYVMAKSIAWRMLKELAGAQLKTKNESELYVEFANGGVLQLKGSENRDSLRGASLRSLVLDEFAYMAQETWTEVLRPATADQLAPVMFISTPSGWNWAKELYDYACDPKNQGWRAWQYTTIQGGNVSAEEVEAARRELPERIFRQEFEASFETLANRVYSSFDRSRHLRSDLARIQDVAELHIGMDFNVDPMTAVVGVKAGDQLHIVDEIVLPDSHTQEMASEIARRYPKHKIIMYPDPSGRARKTSARGKTDFSLLTDAGFRVVAPRQAPAIMDRVNEVQAAFVSGNNSTRLYVHPDCKELVRGLEGQTFRNGMPDKTSGLDHQLDALGYLVHGVLPLRRDIIFTGIGSAM
jgi:hypothetical protein